MNGLVNRLLNFVMKNWTMLRTFQMPLVLSFRMIILKHILYKYISICVADNILLIFKQNTVLFRVSFYTRSFACCLLTS